MYSDHSRPMWSQALKMLDRADRLQRQFFQLHQQVQSGPSWEPPVDMLETPDMLFIEVALPGVAQDTVRVVIDSSTLAVNGERPFAAGPDMIIQRMEIPYGRFERRIDLKGAHFEIRENVLENGCLKLVLKKI